MRLSGRVSVGLSLGLIGVYLDLGDAMTALSRL
jgi:hypothetical protein